MKGNFFIFYFFRYIYFTTLELIVKYNILQMPFGFGFAELSPFLDMVPKQLVNGTSSKDVISGKILFFGSSVYKLFKIVP